MFTLSTLLLAETVLAQDAPVLPPPAQARIHRKDRLVTKLSHAVSAANFGELKKLRTDQSIAKFKNFVEDQYLNKKLDMMGERLEEGLEERLEEVLEERLEEVLEEKHEGGLSATTAAPRLSIKEEEKMIADKIIDEDIDQHVTDPKLASVAKGVEHEIANTVVDNLEERIRRMNAGEEVSDEEENKKLVQEIVGNVMALVKDAPEEKKAELEKTLQKTFEKEVGKDIQDFSTKEGKKRALQSVASQVAPVVANLLPAPGGDIVNKGVQIAGAFADSPALQAIAGLVDNATGGTIGTTVANMFAKIFGSNR